VLPGSVAACCRAYVFCNTTFYRFWPSGRVSFRRSPATCACKTFTPTITYHTVAPSSLQYRGTGPRTPNTTTPLTRCRGCHRRRCMGITYLAAAFPSPNCFTFLPRRTYRWLPDSCYTILPGASTGNSHTCLLTGLHTWPVWEFCTNMPYLAARTLHVPFPWRLPFFPPFSHLPSPPSCQ